MSENKFEFPRTSTEILEGAAEVIEQHGWCQGAMTDTEGRVCLMGSMVKSAKVNSPAFYEAVNRVQAVIDTPMIANWNDEPSRSVEDVMLILKRAAARE